MNLFLCKAAPHCCHCVFVRIRGEAQENSARAKRRHDIRHEVRQTGKRLCCPTQSQDCFDRHMVLPSYHGSSCRLRALEAEVEHGSSCRHRVLEAEVVEVVCLAAPPFSFLLLLPCLLRGCFACFLAIKPCHCHSPSPSRARAKKKFRANARKKQLQTKHPRSAKTHPRK